jgi:hypothetical protein
MNAPNKSLRAILAWMSIVAYCVLGIADTHAQSGAARLKNNAQDAAVTDPGLRLRGTADDLAIGQNNALFDDTQAASLTFQRDSQNDIQTHTADIFLGYAFPFAQSNNKHLLPYIGLNKSKIKTSGYFNPEESREVRTIGISGDLFWIAPLSFLDMAQGYFINGRIEGGSDHIDKTHFQTVALSIRPYVGDINRKPFPFTSFDIYVFPFLTLFVDATNYSQRSIFAAVANNQNNSRRVGAELGLAIADGEDRVRYSYRYLKLNDWKGEGDVSHASQALEVRLDENGFVKLVLQRNHGRPDRTFTPEKLTSLLLAFRY